MKRRRSSSDIESGGDAVELPDDMWLFLAVEHMGCESIVELSQTSRAHATRFRPLLKFMHQCVVRLTASGMLGNPLGLHVKDPVMDAEHTAALECTQLQFRAPSDLMVQLRYSRTFATFADMRKHRLWLAARCAVQLGVEPLHMGMGCYPERQAIGIRLTLPTAYYHRSWWDKLRPQFADAPCIRHLVRKFVYENQSVEVKKQRQAISARQQRLAALMSRATLWNKHDDDATTCAASTTPINDGHHKTAPASSPYMAIYGTDYDDHMYALYRVCGITKRSATLVFTLVRVYMPYRRIHDSAYMRTVTAQNGILRCVKGNVFVFENEAQMLRSVRATNNYHVTLDVAAAARDCYFFQGSVY
jgi:hypothetical protein